MVEEVRETDYNLSPSLFVETNDKIHHRPISKILTELKSARLESERADSVLTELLQKLGMAC